MRRSTAQSAAPCFSPLPSLPSSAHRVTHARPTGRPIAKADRSASVALLHLACFADADESQRSLLLRLLLLAFTARMYACMYLWCVGVGLRRDGMGWDGMGCRRPASMAACLLCTRQHPPQLVARTHAPGLPDDGTHRDSGKLDGWTDGRTDGQPSCEI
ncbi:hypothetical protein BKA81DRAFT_367062 [Phyllosticta paracitricarpa]